MFSRAELEFQKGLHLSDEQINAIKEVKFPIVHEPEPSADTKEGPNTPVPAGKEEDDESAGPTPSANKPPSKKLKVKEVHIGQINKVPETKTEMHLRCWGSGRWRVCTKVPRVYTRLCTRNAYLSVTYPDQEGLAEAIELCLKMAVLADVVSGAMFMSPIAGAQAMHTYLTICLRAQFGTMVTEQIRVGLRFTKLCGTWG